MSGYALAANLQQVLQYALPDTVCYLGIPKLFHDPVIIYLWRDGPPEDRVKTTDTVRRHHMFHIHLLVQSTGDDNEAELIWMDICERLADAFQVNRRLLGTGQNSTISPKPLGSQYVLLDNGTEYRAAAWVWDAEEQLTFQFA